MPFRSFPRSKTKSGSRELFPEPAKIAPEPCLVAHIDGGARGNPGPAGYGVFVQDQAGRPVTELRKYLGRQTNNFAEYSGLLAALEYAIQHGYKALQVFSDSELLVKQLKGVYQVRSEGLLPLYQQAKAMTRELEFFKITHVRREQNKDADRLANLAMDEGSRR